MNPKIFTPIKVDNPTQNQMDIINLLIGRYQYLTTKTDGMDGYLPHLCKIIEVQKVVFLMITKECSFIMLHGRMGWRKYYQSSY